MGQLFDPDSTLSPTEPQPGTCFARAAALIERYEHVPAKGGAKVWVDLYKVLRAHAEHYRDIGIDHFAETLELLAARARGAFQRHQFHGPPLPDTLRHPREVLREKLA